MRLSQQKLKREDPNNCDPHELKVVYDHTRIASYRHWGARSVGGRVRLLALDSRNAEQAGGLSSLRQTHWKSCVPKRLFIAFIMPGHFKRLL